MKALENSAAIVGAVMVALLMVVIGWFFGVAPRLNAANAASAANEQQLSENAALTTTLQGRKEAAKLMPTYQAGLSDAHDALPLTEGLADWRRTLDAMVAATGVTLVQDGVADPVVIANTLALADAAAAVGKQSYVEALAFKGLVATPFTIEFAGSPSQIGAFLTELQGDDHRFYLVSDLTSTTYTSDGTILGRPVFAGDADVAVSGYLFTLPNGASAAVPAAPAAPSSPAPVTTVEPTVAPTTAAPAGAPAG